MISIAQCKMPLHCQARYRCVFRYQLKRLMCREGAFADKKVHDEHLRRLGVGRLDIMSIEELAIRNCGEGLQSLISKKGQESKVPTTSELNPEEHHGHTGRDESGAAA